MKTLQKIINWPFLALIRLYQLTLSFDHSPLRVFYPQGYCQFQPTCSQYMYESIERFGILRGIILGTWRILRCNPWACGGSDPVPQSFKLPKFKERR